MKCKRRWVSVNARHLNKTWLARSLTAYLCYTCAAFFLSLRCPCGDWAGVPFASELREDLPNFLCASQSAANQGSSKRIHGGQCA